MMSCSNLAAMCPCPSSMTTSIPCMTIRSIAMSASLMANWVCRPSQPGLNSAQVHNVHECYDAVIHAFEMRADSNFWSQSYDGMDGTVQAITHAFAFHIHNLRGRHTNVCLCMQG
eukprot:gnl/MRDRNA2_/MRDRNA2_66948_c0_seq2.p1 gnl/MRDRNA2_/MRDRNA2_66948_c0~~gnl/MRDRNA2_/MRDRNA2_66948_c0_seq2.p1  ORF type:complete len:115 (+),score=2.83 gnl/MRDRNA2_/MRDRNA2_66948_c0_seq2:3-347(+)